MAQRSAAPSPVEITEVRGLLGRLAFLAAAAALRREPQFTPDLVPDFLHTTSPKNPFFRHAETAFFLAKRGGRIVGRASATVDRNANETQKESVALFGHFEAADGDAESTAALIAACEAFGRARKQTILRGPIDMSTNYRVGLLVEGHAFPPAIMMPWNPPGHAALLEGCGLVKAKDVVSMEVDRAAMVESRYTKLADRARERGGYQVRTFDLRRFDEEIALVRSLYNASWAMNWGFVPVDLDEFAYEAKGLKQILDPNLGFFVEKGGKPLGFALSIPDAAIAIREVRGRLLPFGWWKLLRRIKTLDRMRTVLLGVLPEARKSGIDAILYAETTRRGLARGIVAGEFGWLLENNDEIIRGILACGARITRRYRIYERPIPS
jgi:GNAT superfamily N-acetyltransferase